MQIAQRYGAKVSLSLAGRGMFLIVVKNHAGLDHLIKSVGGSLIARLNANRALVVMTLPSYLGLRASSEVSFIGRECRSTTPSSRIGCVSSTFIGL